MVSPGELPAWRGVLPEMGVGFLERLSAAQLNALLPQLRPTQLTRAQASFLLARAVQRDNVSARGASAGEGRAAGAVPWCPSAAPDLAPPHACPGCQPPQPLCCGRVPERGQRVSLQVTAGEAARLCPLLPGLGPVSLAAVLAPLRVQGCACLGPALPLLSAAQTASLLQALQPPDSWPRCLLPLLPLQLLRPGAQALRGAPRDPNLPWSPQQCPGLAGGGHELHRAAGAGTGGFPGGSPDPLRPAPLPACQPEALRAGGGAQASCALRGGAGVAGTSVPHGVTRLPAGTELSGEDLDRLGPLVGFLSRESVARVRPESLLPRLGDLQDTCLAAEAAAELGRLLLSEQVLGPPAGWRLPALQQLGRLVFLLPLESLRALPRDLLSRDTVEQLLQSQRDWEQSELGRLCHPPGTPGAGPSPQEVLVAPLVAAARPGDRAPVPSCADVRATFPAAWSAAQLAAMAPRQLEDCLGLLSRDPALRPSQLRAALGQARRLWGSARALEPAQTLRLGRLATQLGALELRELLLPDWGALSALGELDGWSPEQMRAVASAFLRQRGASVRDLGLPELVALGHLLCGLPAAELRGLDSWELSKAAPFLGSLSLRCTEQQAEVLAAHLTASAAFGPAAAWGPEVFAEVGTLAAGLPDIVLSALVPEQIWALTPRAIAAVPAPKFAVVFGPAQLRILSSAQAAAVTLRQRRWLGSAQREALASAQREGEAAQDGPGRSGARPPSDFSLALLLCLARCFL
ncbi:stereocilin [Ciconia maguari]